MNKVTIFVGPMSSDVMTDYSSRLVSPSTSRLKPKRYPEGIENDIRPGRSLRCTQLASGFLSQVSLSVYPVGDVEGQPMDFLRYLDIADTAQISTS